MDRISQKRKVEIETADETPEAKHCCHYPLQFLPSPSKLKEDHSASPLLTFGCLSNTLS
jgi:hypothetical protein